MSYDCLQPRHWYGERMPQSLDYHRGLRDLAREYQKSQYTDIDLREKLLALALVRRDGRRHTYLVREVNILFCSKIAMQKLDLSNRAICVVKLDYMKFNYFFAGGAQHETLGEPVHP